MTRLADGSWLVAERHAHNAKPNAQRWSPDGALIDTLRIGSDFVDLKADPAAGFPVGYEDGVATMVRDREWHRVSIAEAKAQIAPYARRSLGSVPEVSGDARP